MPTALVFCNEHGLVQDRHGIDIGRSSSAVIVGGTGQCPLCGRPAQYVDGNYRSDSAGAVSVNMRLTPFQVYRLKELLKQYEVAPATAVDGDAAAKEQAKQLEKGLRQNVPEIGKFLDAVSGKRAMGIAAWIGVLVSLITLFITVGTQGLSEEDMSRVVSETVSQTLEEQQRAEQASTTPPEGQPPSPEQPPPATELPTPKTR